VELGISGKTALITGAGRGIGQSIAESLANEGVEIVGISRNSKSSSEETSSFPGTMITADLFDDVERRLALERISRDFSKIDIVINNVGGTMEVSNPLASYKDFENVLKFNLGIAVDTNNFFIPGMKERRWGRICHISSISALENHGPPAYCASKAALNAYVRSVGRFLAEFNIVLTGVMPGAILTNGGYWEDMKNNNPEKLENYLQNRMSSKRLGKVEEISELVCFLVSEHSSFMFGSNVLADGGQGRLFAQN
jgi:3-oxoacyl-[acyl-carrier protein] reductase